LELAPSLGLERVIVETHVEAAVKAICESNLDRSSLAILFRELRSRAIIDFPACLFSHCPRACSVADMQADICLNCNGTVMWQDKVPEFVALLPVVCLEGVEVSFPPFFTLNRWAWLEIKQGWAVVG
ncbi:hypothetical protein BAE44_0002075, partial [Dichanthelium oligosanthes]